MLFYDLMPSPVFSTGYVRCLPFAFLTLRWRRLRLEPLPGTFSSVLCITATHLTACANVGRRFCPSYHSIIKRLPAGRWLYKNDVDDDGFHSAN